MYHSVLRGSQGLRPDDLERMKESLSDICQGQTPWLIHSKWSNMVAKIIIVTSGVYLNMRPAGSASTVAAVDPAFTDPLYSHPLTMDWIN